MAKFPKIAPNRILVILAGIVFVYAGCMAKDIPTRSIPKNFAMAQEGNQLVVSTAGGFWNETYIRTEGHYELNRAANEYSPSAENLSMIPYLGQVKLGDRLFFCGNVGTVFIVYPAWNLTIFNHRLSGVNSC